jgi:hypothetical protein
MDSHFIILSRSPGGHGRRIVETATMSNLTAMWRPATFPCLLTSNVHIELIGDGSASRGAFMHDDDEDDNIMHYTTPMWCHLLIFGFAVSIAVGICQLCS